MRVDIVSAGILIGIGYHIKVSTFKIFYSFISGDICVCIYFNFNDGISCQNIFRCKIIKISSAGFQIKVNNTVTELTCLRDRSLSDSRICSFVFGSGIIILIVGVSYSEVLN